MFATFSWFIACSDKHNIFRAEFPLNSNAFKFFRNSIICQSVGFAYNGLGEFVKGNGLARIFSQVEMPDRRSLWRFAILLYAKCLMLQAIRIYRFAQRVSSFAKENIFIICYKV